MVEDQSTPNLKESDERRRAGGRAEEQVEEGGGGYFFHKPKPFFESAYGEYPTSFPFIRKGGAVSSAMQS